MMENHVEQEAAKNQALTRKENKRFWLKLVIGIFFFLGLAYVLYWLFIARFYVTTDDAYVAGNTVQTMPQISGHVLKILADETDFVQKGEVVTCLDPIDVRIALQTEEANLALTLRNTSQLYFNIAKELDNIAIQQANLEKLQEHLLRRKPLARENVISTETLTDLQSDVSSAKASLDLAKVRLASATALVANSTLYNHPQVRLATTRLRDAFLNFQRAVIYAPETGYIAKRPVQVGQEVTPSTILMIIVPLNQIWVDANYKETQLKNIRIDQPVKLTADAYGRHVVYHGHVVGLSPGTGSAFDILPPQNATGNWIKIVQRLPVRIEIDPSDLKRYPLRIGLSVRVTVNTRNRRGKVLSRIPRREVIYRTEDYNANVKKANALIERIYKANAPNLSCH
jgi:membrane fusion protein, multidrug efflux system